jgi:hypothetical protein
MRLFIKTTIFELKDVKIEGPLLWDFTPCSSNRSFGWKIIEIVAKIVP